MARGTVSKRSYGNSRTTRNPFATYLTSRSYLKRDVERTTAQYMQATLTAHPSRAVIGRATIIVIPAIFHPLGHIACGVEKAETIGLERPDRGRSLRLAGIALPAVRLTGAHVASPPV